MKKQIQVVLMMVTLCFVIALTPSSALAGQVSKTFSWTAGDARPNVPAKIKREGRSYYLAKTSEIFKKDKADNQLRKYSFQHSKPLTPQQFGQNDEFKKQFPNIMEAREEGYFGYLTPARFAITPIIEKRRTPVDKFMHIEHLSDNDVGRVDPTAVFVVRSDCDWDATKEEILDYAGITWNIEKTSQAGYPLEYSADVLYRGHESYLELAHYRVRVTYKGVAAKPGTALCMTATYNSDEDVAAKVREQNTTKTIMNKMQDERGQRFDPPPQNLPSADSRKKNNTLALLGGGVCVVLTIIVLLCFAGMFLRRRTKDSHTKHKEVMRDL